MSLKSFSDFKKNEDQSNTEPKTGFPKVNEPKPDSDGVREPVNRIKRGKKNKPKKPSIKKPTIKKPTVSESEQKRVLLDVFNNIEFINKVAVFKKTMKAKDALLTLENGKIDKNKLWYFIMDRNEDTIQIVKYNVDEGFNLVKFTNEVFGFYKKNESNSYLKNIQISGAKEFVVISGISNKENKEKIKKDFIKLLSK